MTYSDLLLTLNFDPNFAALNATQKKGLVNAQIKKLFDCIKDSQGCRDFYACGNEIVDFHTTPIPPFNVCVDVLYTTPIPPFNVCVDVLNTSLIPPFNVCVDVLNASSIPPFNVCI